MNAQELRNRTKKFAIEVVRFCRRLPSEWEVRELGKQLIRSGTAVAANYRASCRGRSPKEFCAKIGVVAEEADESLLWLELLIVASPGVAGVEHTGLLKEADELTAIFTSSYKTAKENLKKNRRDNKRQARRD
jgi:four helix bundle protein